MKATINISPAMLHRMRRLAYKGPDVAIPQRTDEALERRGLVKFSKPHDTAILTKKIEITAVGWNILDQHPR